MDHQNRKGNETNMLTRKKEPAMENSSIQLDTRVARLETRMDHLDSAVKDLRTSMEAKFEQMAQKFDHVNERISNLHASMNEKFGEIKVWALTLLGGGLGFGILTVVARAMHWI
jgi:chaperonin cofactor prefoldin